MPGPPVVAPDYQGKVRYNCICRLIDLGFGQFDFVDTYLGLEAAGDKARNCCDYGALGLIGPHWDLLGEAFHP